MDKERTAGSGANERCCTGLAIEGACRAGRLTCDMGSSGLPSLANKTTLGAQERTFVGYRFERLPLTAADRELRRMVKRALGYGRSISGRPDAS